MLLNKRIILFVIFIMIITIFNNCNKANKKISEIEKCKKIKNDFREKITPVINDFINALLDKKFEKALSYITDDCGIGITANEYYGPNVLYSVIKKKDILNGLKDKNSLIYLSIYGNEKYGEKYKIRTQEVYGIYISCLEKYKTYKDVDGDISLLYDNLSGKSFSVIGKFKKIYDIYITLPLSYFKDYESQLNKNAGKIDWEKAIENDKKEENKPVDNR